MGGGDKWRIQIGRFSILDRVLDRLRPQCDNIVFNSNSDPAAAPQGLTVVADSVPDYPGPLAGILAGLDWAAQHAPGFRGSSACRATVLSCRAIWLRACIRREARAMRRWLAPSRQAAGIRPSRSGRFGCGKIYAKRSLPSRCAQFTDGPRDIRLPSPGGTMRLSIPSSMSIRPRMRPKPRRWPRATRMRDRWSVRFGREPARRK